MSTDPRQTTSTTPENDKRFFHVLVFGSLLVPFICIPYIPIRRHLLLLRRSIHALSDNTALVQHELSNTLLNTQLRKEETLKLADQLHALRVKFDATSKRVAECENARLISERDMAERLRAASDRAADADAARLKSEEALRRQIDILRRRANMERRVLIPYEVLQDVCTSLGDTAAFIEEVEIQLGWSHSIPRDRGIDRMRQLALRLHAMAQAKVRLLQDEYLSMSTTLSHQHYSNDP
ncbi:hypothetical protein JB92DRAFT_3128362 [Gautieria morchelliformis]|nr:hypothetical protein JB92DRAFT_3128362 [Gautieria morchelliformis]